MKFKKVLAAGIAAVMAVSSLTLPTFADIEYFGGSSVNVRCQLGDYVVEGKAYYGYSGTEPNLEQDLNLTIVDYVGKDSTVKIPKTIKTSEYVSAEEDSTYIREILEANEIVNITNVSIGAFPETVTALTVDSDDERFTVVDGVLYDKDVTMPVSIPGGKSSITLPATVDRMEVDYLEGNSDYEGYNYDKESMLFANEIYQVETLKEIKVAADNKTFKSEDGVLYSADGKWLVAYPSGKEAKEYLIPEGVENIAIRRFTNPNLNKITLSSTTTSMVIWEDIGTSKFNPELFYECKNLQEIDVAEGNTNYTSKDGVLFSYGKYFDYVTMKDVLYVNHLVAYPCGKQDKEYTVPEDVSGFEWSVIRPTTNASAPFYNNPYLETVTFANPYISLTYSSSPTNLLFNNCPNFKTVKGYVGSTAEQYMNAGNYYDASTREIVDTLPYKFVPITYTVEDTNKTGVEVEGALPYATVLNVEKTDESETSVTYDITLADSDGNAVQPTEAVSVKLPVPEGMETEGLKVYRVESDGKYTDMNATYADGFMTFTTEHFSKYVITAENLPENTTSSSNTTNPAETTTSTTAENGNTQNGASDDKNVPTGVVLALLPAAAAAAGVIISRKRK